MASLASGAGLMPWHLAARSVVRWPSRAHGPADRSRRPHQWRCVGERDLRLPRSRRGSPSHRRAPRSPARRSGRSARQARPGLRGRILGHTRHGPGIRPPQPARRYPGHDGHSHTADARSPLGTRRRSPSARPHTSWAATTEPARMHWCWPPPTATPSRKSPRLRYRCATRRPPRWEGRSSSSAARPSPATTPAHRWPPSKPSTPYATPRPSSAIFPSHWRMPRQ
jgi:hypothetical protein